MKKKEFELLKEEEDLSDMDPPSKTRQVTNKLKRKLKLTQTTLSKTRQTCKRIRLEKEKQDQKIQQMEKDILRMDNEGSNGTIVISK